MCTWCNVNDAQLIITALQLGPSSLNRGNALQQKDYGKMEFFHIGKVGWLIKQHVCFPEIRRKQVIRIEKTQGKSHNNFKNHCRFFPTIHLDKLWTVDNLYIVGYIDAYSWKKIGIQNLKFWEIVFFVFDWMNEGAVFLIISNRDISKRNCLFTALLNCRELK